MERDIRIQIIRMLVVTLAICGLLVWSFDFVVNGIQSNVYLNGTIIVVFLFGFSLVFSHVLCLRDERVALDALKEAFSDAKIITEKDFIDEYWRHGRCMQNGEIFNRPKLLGHIFEMTYDEMMRTKKMRISLTTMQSMVEGIDNRIFDQRSLSNYITGLLVFLGLIGTFIGLMDMVASVGGIIGSLGDATGPGSDQTAAFAKLVNDLKGPLIGMATGFSSSLFGLFGSLMLGLLGRFSAMATNALKLHFEAWIAGVAQIENEEYVPDADSELRGPTGEEGLRQLTGSVKALTQSFGGIADDFLRTIGTVDALADAQKAQNKLVQAQTERLESLAEMQHLLVNMGENMSHILKAFKENAHETRTMQTAIQSDMSKGFTDLAQTMRGLSELDLAERRHLMDNLGNVSAELRTGFGGLATTMQTLGTTNRSVEAAMSGFSTSAGKMLAQAESQHRELIEALQVMAARQSNMPLSASVDPNQIRQIENRLEDSIMQMSERMRADYSRFAGDVRQAEMQRGQRYSDPNDVALFAEPQPKAEAPRRAAAASGSGNDTMNALNRLRSLYGNRSKGDN